MESRDMASKAAHGDGEGICAVCWHTEPYKHRRLWRDYPIHSAQRGRKRQDILTSSTNSLIKNGFQAKLCERRAFHVLHCLDILRQPVTLLEGNWGLPTA